MNILRSIVAIVLALLVGGLLVGAIEFAGMLLFPIQGITADTKFDEIQTALEAAPANVRIPAMLMVVLAHVVGVFVAGGIAATVAGSRKMAHALGIGAVFLVFGIINLAMIPHPLWFAIADVAVCLPAAWLGGKLVGVGGVHVGTAP